MRLEWRVRILLFALSLNIGALRTVAAGDWPQDYVVHKDSESPDSRYGVLVLSHEAAVDNDQTEENIPAWQICRHDRHSTKSAEQIISRDKIIAIWESKTELEPYKICFGDVNPNRSLLAASLALRVCVFPPKSSS